MRVLIVDDSPVSREHLGFIVRRAGYDPYMFESAEALWFWIEENGLSQSLIFLDWVMPELHGPDLCKMIRAKYPQANTYIIMASAKSESSDVAAGLNSGADDYIRKPFDTQEVHARLSVGVRTLTLRFELEDANQKRFKAERYAGVGQLAAGAAHEINNPLGFLKSNLSLFQEELPGFFDLVRRSMNPLEAIDEVRASIDRAELAESLADYVDMLADMGHGVDRIDAIVDSLKSFTADVSIKHSGLDIDELIRSSVSPTVKLDLDAGHTLAGDYQQLRSLLDELIENACWAVQEGGEIEVSTGVVGDQIRLVVADTGCGIEPDNLLRVTDPFFTTKSIGSALGMGLSRAQAIVRNHGGHLSLTSTVGKGTRVVCELPLR